MRSPTNWHTSGSLFRHEYEDLVCLAEKHLAQQDPIVNVRATQQSLQLGCLSFRSTGQRSQMRVGTYLWKNDVNSQEDVRLCLIRYSTIPPVSHCEVRVIIEDIHLPRATLV